MPSILILEDDSRLADLLRRGLEQEGYQVSLAYEGNTGLRAAISGSHDLVISDIMLPGINGLELCKHIKSERPQLPVLMLTALGSTDDKVEGFDSGADDYLVKPFEFRELFARIRALLKRAGQNIDIVSELSFGDLRMNLHTMQVQRAGQAIELTPKEFKLMQYFLENPGRVLSRPEIAKHVWDMHFDTGTNFIDVYINYLRNKVDKPFPEKLIHTKPGMGFILKQDAH
jgi:DNA-binding response OmpR family regulator